VIHLFGMPPKPVDTFDSALDQLHCSLQLAWAAVQVGSGGADAAMTSQRFQKLMRLKSLLMHFKTYPTSWLARSLVFG
jgi:hypothetical protein